MPGVNEILGYRGDPNLGLASNAGAGRVAGDTDVSGLSQIVRDIALNNFQKNRILFDQKIKDRDAAYQMLDDEALVLDNVLEQHRGIVDGKIKAVHDIFFEANGDVMGNAQTYRKFTAAIKEAKDHIKQAQKWYLGVTRDAEDRKKVSNPIDQRKYDTHLNKELSRSSADFWGLYQPFAPITDYDLGVVAKDWRQITSTRQDGLYNVTDIMPDVRGTLNEYRGNYLKNDYNHWFVKYVDDMLSVPNADDLVERVQQGINRLNQETGAQPGQGNYVEPLRVRKDPATNRWMLEDDYGTAAAKIKLSEARKVSSREFDNERARFQLGNAELAEQRRHNRATEGLQQAQLNLEKWKETQKGGTSQVNGAMERAKRIFSDLQKLADANGVISPDKMRQLNAEQLKYLGYERPVEGGDQSKIAYQGLTLDRDDDGTVKDAIQLNADGTIRVMKGATEYIKEGKKGWAGTWDPTRSTNLYNVATNILNEELTKAGSKELNSYWGIDVTGGTTQMQEGGITTVSGSSVQKLSGKINRSSLVPGSKYDVNGTVYTWNGTNLVQQ